MPTFLANSFRMFNSREIEPALPESKDEAINGKGIDNVSRILGEGIGKMEFPDSNYKIKLKNIVIMTICKYYCFKIKKSMGIFF